MRYLKWTDHEKAAHGETMQKLTMKQARKIRELHASGEVSRIALSTRFAISRHAIDKLLQGKTYQEAE